jgi:hypothetical protein
MQANLIILTLRIKFNMIELKKIIISLWRKSVLMGFFIYINDQTKAQYLIIQQKVKKLREELDYLKVLCDPKHFIGKLETKATCLKMPEPIIKSWGIA